MIKFKRRIQDEVKANSTFIAATTTIVGKIVGQGSYIFCGRVQGDCDIDGPVTLAANAHWIGTLRATDIVVAGTVEGDVIADRRVEIAGSAKVTGSLCGDSIAVAEGAIIEGDIKVVNGATPVEFEEKRNATLASPALDNAANEN